MIATRGVRLPKHITGVPSVAESFAVPSPSISDDSREIVIFGHPSEHLAGHCRVGHQDCWVSWPSRGLASGDFATRHSTYYVNNLADGGSATTAKIDGDRPTTIKEILER